jgi:type I restriction enzyme M protein
MSSAASNLVNKVWNYCNLLRDDGVSYGDYVEQLTYLLFLKMDYERSRPPYKKSTINDEPASILLDCTRAHAIR